MATVLCYGASNGYGYFDNKGGYVERIKLGFMAEADADVRPVTVIYNLSAPGQSSLPIIRRLVEDARHFTALNNGGRCLAVLALGSADAIVMPGREAPQSPLPQFQRCLTELGEICVQSSILPIFLGPVPVRGKAFQPYERTGAVLDPILAAEYNGLVEDQAQKVGAPYIHIAPALSSGYGLEHNLSDDGIHMSPQGHAIVAEMVDMTIRELLNEARSLPET